MNEIQNPKAIPFIVKNHLGSYQLTQQAENLITKINTPISIVTVAGLYRTGKSFLLNRVIINKAKGFNVGPTVNPCTKGLWIWNQPIYTADNISVLVVDTEGLGALDQQTNHDTKIFCLAVLLSTTFIYNSVGSIDEGALQNLSLVLNLVSSIDQDQQSNRPSFVWVVRDFSLQLINEKGTTITPKQYLQMALNTEIVKESQKIAIRNTIRNAFSERDCFTLYKPLIDETKLQNLDNVPLDDLRPQFVTQTMSLRKKIFSTLKQFKLNNCSNLKGAQYIMMTKKYVTAINDGKVPNMTDTWTFIKQQKCRQVLEYLQQSCLQKINSKLMPKFPLKDQNLKQILSQLYSQISNEFIKSTYHETSTQQLQSFWQRVRKQILNANEQQRKQTIKSILVKQFQGFSKKLHSNFYNQLQEFSQDLKKNFKTNLSNSYGQKIDGFQIALQNFCDKKINQGLKIFFNKQKLQIKKLIQIKSQIESNYQKQFNEMQDYSSNERKQLKNQLSLVQKQLFEKQQQKRNIQTELLTKKTQFQIQKQKSKTQRDQMKNLMESMKQQISTYQNKNQDCQKTTLTIKKQFQKERALFSQKQEHLQNKLSEIELKYKQVKIQQETNGGRYETQRKGIMANFQDKMKNLLKQNKEKSQKLFQLQSLVEDLKQQNQKFKEKNCQIKQKFESEKKALKQKLVNDMSNKKQSFSFQLEESKKEIYRIQDNYNKVIMETKQIEIKYKQLLDEIKQVRSNNQKQIAIHMQKVQFQQMQINQLKTTNQQLKRSYQKAMDTVQDCSKNNQNKYQVRLVQMTQQHQQQIKRVEKQFQFRIKQMKNQNYILSKQREDLQIQISIQRNKFEVKQKQYKQYYQKMETNYQNLSMKYTSTERDYKDISLEKQTHFVMKVKQLETELEHNKEKYFKELDQARKSSQQALSVLKNYSQMERQQWDRRLIDEREKFQKKIKCQIQEIQKRMSQQKLSMDQEISMLMQKLETQDKFYNQKIQNMQYDYDIQMQKKINQFGEQKVQLNKRNALLNQQIQMTKKNLQSKLQQNAKSYEQRQASLRNQLQTEHQQALSKVKDDKMFIQQKFQTLKKSNRQVQQSNLMLKNDLDKERALFKQKQHNYLKQINDLQSRLSSQIISHNKAMQEYTISTQSQRSRLNSQINQLKVGRSKLQQEKSTIQINFQHQRSTFQTRVNYLESRYRQKQEDYNDLMNKFQVTTSYLTKNNQNLSKQLANQKGKVHGDFQTKIKIKEQQFRKNMKELEDRIIRFQTQNKSLRDKVILLQMKLNTKDQHQSDYASINMEEMREEYQKKIEEMRVYIQKLKKDNKFLKNEKELMQLSQGLLNQSKIVSKEQRFEKSERQSIINGLNHNHQFSRSRLDDDFSKSKINYNQVSRTPIGQSEVQNKNIVNMRGQNQNQHQGPYSTATKYQRRTNNY